MNTITITEQRLQELLDLAIAKTKAVQSAEAPDCMVHNSHVIINNHYGDVYEEDHDPQPVKEPAPTRTPIPIRTPEPRIRKSLTTLMLGAEKLMADLDKRNPSGFTKDAKAAASALQARFDDLQLALKGDTGLQHVQRAYLLMVVQLALASDLSGVFHE